MDIKKYVNDINAAHDVVVWSKTSCPYCTQVKNLYTQEGVKFNAIELDTVTNGSSIQQILQEISGIRTVPNIFIKGKHLPEISDDTFAAHKNGKLKQMLVANTTSINATETVVTVATTTAKQVKRLGNFDANPNKQKKIKTSEKRTTIPDIAIGGNYDYDLFVIGGGSGGLACAKEAAKFNKRVAVADFVKPTSTYPHSTWGLGGTCVNVGCIPKKLMHTAGLLGEGMDDAHHYGWNVTKGKHSWKKLVEGVQKHIKGLNKGYETSLLDKKIDYFNLFAQFKNKNNNHEIFMTDGNKTNPKNIIKTARRIVLAIGGRPKLPDIPGAAECCITSDDIFALQENPGQNVLVIGASYVALECAGFLTALGHQVTVMVRSILLRGFDQEIAGKIGQYMTKQGTKFLRGKVPTRMKKGETEKDRIEVWYTDKISSEENHVKEESDQFDTVLCAIGRDPCTKDLGLSCAGVTQNAKLKIPVFREQTNVSHIYAIGDAAAIYGIQDSLELTPVAIQAGKLLSRRLFGDAIMQMDYELVPTTIFTPLEYGCIGLTEDAARKKLGEDNIKVYHQIFQPLEMTLPGRMDNAQEDHCFTKLVIDLTDKSKVIGFHYLGPNAAEVTQGFALAMKLGANKGQFDNVVGIHPSNAENLTTLDIFKGSGKSAEKEDC